MAKSEGNGFTPEELITGNHKLLEQGYSPMTVRFFMLQCHYASTLDFSNDALRAAQKGYKRLMEGYKTASNITPSKDSSVDVESLSLACAAAMNDDFNTPILISKLFEAVKMANLIHAGSERATEKDIDALQKLMDDYIFQVLGFRKEETEAESGGDLTPGLMELVIKLRKSAKLNRDFTTADQIRDELSRLGITLKDSADGTSFTLS
jgi:cysteinyl-tRNA synthetase